MSLRCLRCTPDVVNMRKAPRKKIVTLTKDVMLRMHLMAVQMCKAKISLMDMISNVLSNRIKVLLS